MADINELFKTFNDNITLTNSKSDDVRTGRDALREKIKKWFKDNDKLQPDFCWGVYHHLRIERNQDCLKVWLDEIPSPQKHLFTKIIPVTEPGVPGDIFDQVSIVLVFQLTLTAYA